MDETLKIVETVNSFYTNSFDRLLWVMGSLYAIVGVVLPIIDKWNQRRQLQSEKLEILTSLREEVGKILSNETEKLSKKYEEMLLEESKKLRKQIAEANGGNYLIQGNFLSSQDRHNGAAMSFLNGALSFLESGNDRTLGRCIKNLTSTVGNPGATTALFSEEEWKHAYERFLNKMAEVFSGQNHRFVDDLKKLKRIIKERTGEA